MYQLSSSDHDRLPAVAAHQRNRNRGVMLSDKGWQKLTQAGALHDQWGNRCSYETLSERSLLNQRTVSRILSREVRVDKRSLKIFFAAFGLQLNSNDYVAAAYDPADQTINSLSHYLNTTVHRIEITLSYQELVELHQRLSQDLRHLSHLLHLHEVNGKMPLQATKLS